MFPSLQEFSTDCCDLHSQRLSQCQWNRSRCFSAISLLSLWSKGFPSGLDSEESIHNVGDLGSIPGLGRSHGGRHGNPLKYSCLENPHGQRSLAGYSPWGRKESGMTEWLSTYILYDPMVVGNLISGSSAFSKPSSYIWNFSVHTLLKPNLKDFEHYLASMWSEHNYMVVETFFGTAPLWDWTENWPFPILWPLLSFPNLLTYWAQHFHSIIF